MRKALIITTIVFVVLGIVLTILPMGTIAFLPVGIAVIFAILAVIKSKESQKKFPKILLLVSIVVLLTAIGKDVLVKDKISVDQQFMKEKEDSKQEAQKDLEELEGLE